VSVDIVLGIGEHEWNGSNYSPTLIQATANNARDWSGLPYPYVRVDCMTIIPHDVETVDRLIRELGIARARLEAGRQIHNAP
jgi:hypothetical protein